MVWWQYLPFTFVMVGKNYFIEFKTGLTKLRTIVNANFSNKNEHQLQWNKLIGANNPWSNDRYDTEFKSELLIFYFMCHLDAFVHTYSYVCVKHSCVMLREYLWFLHRCMCVWPRSYIGSVECVLIYPRCRHKKHSFLSFIPFWFLFNYLALFSVMFYIRNGWKCLKIFYCLTLYYN